MPSDGGCGSSAFSRRQPGLPRRIFSFVGVGFGPRLPIYHGIHQNGIAVNLADLPPRRLLHSPLSTGTSGFARWQFRQGTPLSGRMFSVAVASSTANFGSPPCVVHFSVRLALVA